MAKLYFIGSGVHLLHGNGKASADFWRNALPVFSSYGIAVASFKAADDFVAYEEVDQGDVFVFVYNEDESIEVFDQFEDLEHRIKLRNSAALIVNSHRTGRILGNKTASSAFFTARGIPMPRVLRDGDHEDMTVFSNINRGSGRDIEVDASSKIRKGADYFNTEYINTMHVFKDQCYYVSLRSMCVGSVCVATYVRCRPTCEGSPSVHTKNTPLDPDLLNFLFVNAVLRNQDKILSICSKIGAALGPGFYSHDILPCSSSKSLFLCESGFKFDEDTFTRRFQPISHQLLCCAAFDGRETKLMAHAFVAQMRSIGHLLV